MTIHTLSQAALLLAQEGGGDGGAAGGIASFLPLILLVGVFYFIAIRPQRKKMQEHQQLMGALKQGDRVVAAGGIVGTIRRIDDDTMSLQVADNVVIKVDRGSVQKRIDAEA